LIKARKARPADIEKIHTLISYYSAQGVLLPRTEAEVRASIGRFLVLEEGSRVVACASLEPYPTGEAELRSLAVDPEMRGQGLGTRMVKYALKVAQRRKLARVIAVSHTPTVFTRQGFTSTTRFALPGKIARDCRNCPKASTCDLTAVVSALRPENVVQTVLAAVQPVRV
jgi:N-acetylglutamate synthase-like GNAT family acetyltransferase